MLLTTSEKYLLEALPLLRIHPQRLNPKQFEILRNIVIGNLEEEEKVPDNLHKEILSESEMQELKPFVLAKANEILLKPKSDVDELRGICIIARRMQIMLRTPQAWLRLTASGSSDLDARVQGILDREALWKAIQWQSGDRNLSAEKVNKTIGYMKKWIEEATHEKLEAFSNFIVGSPTMSASQPLSIELYDTPSNRLPTTHSCYFTLDLSINYPNDEEFAKKLEYALAAISSLESSGLEAR